LGERENLRARLAASDIEAIGIALKGGLITPEQALHMLDDVDVLRFVGYRPEPSST
jgi:hypothetical protein